MVRTIKANKYGTTRVTIGKKELADWVPGDVSQALVKHWIDLGRQRHLTDLKDAERSLKVEAKLTEIEAQIAELQAANERLASLVLQSARLLSVISTFPHYEIELLKKKAGDGTLEGTDKNRHLFLQIKEENFEKFVRRVFPGHHTDQFLATRTNRDDHA